MENLSSMSDKIIYVPETIAYPPIQYASKHGQIPNKELTQNIYEAVSFDDEETCRLWCKKANAYHAEDIFHSVCHMLCGDGDYVKAKDVKIAC